jgi:hypothetical protein
VCSLWLPLAYMCEFGGIVGALNVREVSSGGAEAWLQCEGAMGSCIPLARPTEGAEGGVCIELWTVAETSVPPLPSPLHCNNSKTHPCPLDRLTRSKTWLRKKSVLFSSNAAPSFGVRIDLQEHTALYRFSFRGQVAALAHGTALAAGCQKPRPPA